MKRRSFLKLFAVGVGGALLPLPLLAGRPETLNPAPEPPKDRLRYSVDLRNEMLESVRALRPGFVVLTTVGGGKKVEHVFAMPRELPPAAYGTLTIPLNIKMLVRRSCYLDSFEILDGAGKWLVKGDGVDLLGAEAGAFLVEGGTFELQNVGLSLS